jgi:serine/threonine-protein kinase
MPLFCSQGHENPEINRFCQKCGQQLPLAVGKILDKRYRLVSYLGHGGFGRTYLAEALHRFNERCVLKEFAPQVQADADLHKAKELFEREAGALHQLRHPQLPGFWELFQADIGGGSGCLFLVQDYIEGPTYFDLLKSGKRLNESEAIQFMCRMLPVLSYIHSKGVIHRDISPDNIILRISDNLPVLIDFGGVKQIAANAVAQCSNMGILQTILGKKGYAPEEQLRHGQVYFSSDLYSLAATVLVLLMGKEPQHLYDVYKGAWRWGKEIMLTDALEAVLQKMLAHKPGDRYWGADIVLQILQSQLPQTSTNLVVSSQTIGMRKPNIQNSNVSQINTLVVAPKAKTVPVQITQPAKQQNYNNQVIQKPPQFMSKIGLWTLRVAGGTSVIALSGFTGWTVMNSLINSTQLPSLEKQVLNNSPKASENTRTAELFKRRQTLGIDETSFNNQVNKRFYEKHPELNDRQLSTSSEDAALREEWYKIAEELLAENQSR